MRAVTVREFGPPEVLRVEEVPRPQPGEGELLVRVHAAGVNPVDAGVRSGRARALVGAELPYVPGFDVSGIVAEGGPGVTEFEVGDEVFAMIDLRRGGGYAEYAIVRQEEAASKPARATFEEAAALPLAALTSWQALFDNAGLREGDVVLIHGGSGGVGSVAVQLAKWRGATVIATASERNQDFLRELGADVAIDYQSQRFEDIARDVDVVLDPIGGETQARSLRVLKDGGTLVALIGLTPEARSPGRDIRVRTMLVHPDADQLRRIAGLVDEGRLRPMVSRVFPIEGAPEAHEQIETGHTRGKVVLEIGGSG
ncbi:MAG TPA: NADP-dependent oxidoreductase [Actinomycetota bacterium]|nr:NADP-dependent oxidoreductase [Actinomycetota bacterium]